MDHRHHPAGLVSVERLPQRKGHAHRRLHVWQGGGAFNALPVEERLHIAREQGERLHDGYPTRSSTASRSAGTGWSIRAFAWSDETEPEFGPLAQMLATPHGRFQQAGDQITFWSGWQEGAIISAWEAVKSIDRQTRPTGGG